MQEWNKVYWIYFSHSFLRWLITYFKIIFSGREYFWYFVLYIVKTHRQKLKNMFIKIKFQYLKCIFAFQFLKCHYLKMLAIHFYPKIVMASTQIVDFF